MPGVVVIGAQWGDEGKGKVVDFLSERADWAVRFQGGNNAGHTLVVGGVKTKLNLIPSGILRPSTQCLIGAGVAINPQVLLDEMSALRKAGVEITPKRLLIDRDAQLILDYHPLIDQARELALGEKRIGTTGRGIGPVYEDRSARRGVRIVELQDLKLLRETLTNNVRDRNAYLQHVLKSDQLVDFEKMWSNVQRFAAELLPFVGNGGLTIWRALGAGRRVVFEGAQAALLDVTFGTVPYVTACNTIAGAVTTGCGIGPKSVDYVLGVAKAYCTRVGAGPFPSELTDALGDRIRERGGEFGTVTGRPRRCGWFDAVALRRAVRLNGCDALAITKLDVLSGLEEVKILSDYELDGALLDDMPALVGDLERIKPRFETLPGWQESLSGKKKISDLPVAAQEFLGRISELSGVPIGLVSVGAERGETIFCESGKWLQDFFRS